MTHSLRAIALVAALFSAPIAAYAVPVDVTGSYSFDGDANVAAFNVAFDTTIEVETTTEFVDLPLTSGSVSVGSETFSSPINLRFATNAIGGFGVLVLSQDTNPFAGPSLPDFFQISAAFAPGTDIADVITTPISVPLLGFDYIIAGTPPTFSFGQNAGLGSISFSPATTTPIPLPASGLLILAGLGAFAGLRRATRSVPAAR
ncbi:MAG: VPLPA-CTERM sorting domain-containing protein [Pseudomonadota bacterium]